MDELNNEDWKQIALFYQNKANDLELKILALELQSIKQRQSEPVEVEED